MKRIVLIACVSKKGKQKAKTRHLYKSPMFKHSLAYAESLKPDMIFILSALHHLVELDKELEPYNVTLSYVPPQKRKPGLHMLSSQEKKLWGAEVLRMLSEKTDLNSDQFIILSGQKYIEPIKDGLTNYVDVLNGMSLFERVPFLKNQLNGR
jgi:hypothetical protein